MLGRPKEGSAGRSGSDKEMPGNAGSKDGSSIGMEIEMLGRPKDGSAGKSGRLSETPGNAGSKDGSSIGIEMLIDGRPRLGSAGRSGKLKEGKSHKANPKSYGATESAPTARQPSPFALPLRPMSFRR